MPIEPDEPEQFEELEAHVAILQTMSDRDLLTDEELDRFFALVAQRALESKRHKVGDRVLSAAETRTLYVNGFVAEAGNAAREI
jgi:hypothetical protein